MDNGKTLNKNSEFDVSEFALKWTVTLNVSAVTDLLALQQSDNPYSVADKALGGDTLNSTVNHTVTVENIMCLFI